MIMIMIIMFIRNRLTYSKISLRWFFTEVLAFEKFD